MWSLLIAAPPYTPPPPPPLRPTTLPLPPTPSPQVPEHGPVTFVPGFFNTSLRLLPKETRLAVLRLDGDMYESYLDSLFNTYALLSVGGFVLIDDYSVEGCARAVTEFRSLHGIEVSVL